MARGDVRRAGVRRRRAPLSNEIARAHVFTRARDVSERVFVGGKTNGRECARARVPERVRQVRVHRFRTRRRRGMSLRVRTRTRRRTQIRVRFQTVDVSKLRKGRQRNACGETRDDVRRGASTVSEMSRAGARREVRRARQTLLHERQSQVRVRDVRMSRTRIGGGVARARDGIRGETSTSRRSSARRRARKWTEKG